MDGSGQLPSRVSVPCGVGSGFDCSPPLSSVSILITVSSCCVASSAWHVWLEMKSPQTRTRAHRRLVVLAFGLSENPVPVLSKTLSRI